MREDEISLRSLIAIIIIATATISIIALIKNEPEPDQWKQDLCKNTGLEYGTEDTTGFTCKTTIHTWEYDQLRKLQEQGIRPQLCGTRNTNRPNNEPNQTS